LIRQVRIKKDALEGFLELCREFFPKENIMLIRGKVKGETAEVIEFLIPPFSTYGEGLSGFSSYMIPFDLSIIGVAHSHPSGNAAPSTGDLNSVFGKLMIISGYPYNERSVNVYNSKGERLPFTVVM
jgi:proteasome lid subunit RPN8/RPN11